MSDLDRYRYRGDDAWRDELADRAAEQADRDHLLGIERRDEAEARVAQMAEDDRLFAERAARDAQLDPRPRWIETP